MRNRKGFTTVELVIVIAVIAILATVLIPTFSGLIDKANDSKALQEAKNAHTNYLIENGGTAPEYMLYDADGRWVALHNGAAVGVYESKENALNALKLNVNRQLNDTGDGKLWIYDDKILIKADRPESGEEEFSYKVSGAAGNDIASIHLPTVYSSDGEPVKLVIMNRGAGGDYTASERYALNTLLLDAGYATLHVRGIPAEYQNTKYLQGAYGAPYGSPAFIESVVAAYKYVTEKYNIATDGCAVFGVSCGGLQSLNLVNAEVLPIKVAVVDAPVVDLHYDCYFGGDWISGSLGGKTAAGVAWMYQFDFCDFDAGTYTIDGVTYKFADRDQTSLEALWQLNKDKVEIYDAYTAGAYTSANGDLAINFSCPVKMWFGLSETTNSVDVGREFITRCQRGGTFAEFRGVNTSTHGVHLVSSKYRLEMLAWIELYLPASDKQINADMMNAHNTVFLNGKNGELIPQSDKTHTYKKVSDYIEIPEGNIISKFCSIAVLNGTNAYCAFYDENKNFINAYMPEESDPTIIYTWKYTEIPPQIPKGAKYIRIAFNNGLNDYSDIDIVMREYALLEFRPTVGYEGKTISILGDSISTFDSVSNDSTVNATIKDNAAHYPSKYNLTRADTWWQQVIDETGMQLCVNNSFGGSWILSHENSGGYGDRCVNLHNDQTGEEPDVIVVYMGTNDFGNGKATFGKAGDINYQTLIVRNADATFTYTKPNTTCEAYAIMLHKIQQRYPDAEIFCMTLLPDRNPDHPVDGRGYGSPAPYNAELRKVIAHFDCALVDLEYCVDRTGEIFDQHFADHRIHPNEKGMDAISDTLLSVMMGK